MLSWILDQKFNSKMLNNSNMLPDALVGNSVKNLRENRNQSKLRRILEANLSLIETYLSVEVYSILLQLQKITKNGANLKYACINCNAVFGQNDPAWSCDRCLLWFHKDCKDRFPIPTDEDPFPKQQQFCKECYTEVYI